MRRRVMHMMGMFLGCLALVVGFVSPAEASKGDAQAFMNSLPSGGHGKTCDKPATARVNSDTAEAVWFKFINQKYKRGRWVTMKGYTRTWTAKPNRWIKFKNVVVGGCGFGKGKYRVVLKARAIVTEIMDDGGGTITRAVGRDKTSRAYKVT